MKTNTIESIIARVTITTDGCWILDGAAPDEDGYCKVRYQGKYWSVHRFFFTHFKGPIPDGHDVDHSCWNRPCCNPDHLSSLPEMENRARQRSALKTNCVNGHPLTDKRTCSKCQAIASAKYRERRAA